MRLSMCFALAAASLSLSAPSAQAGAGVSPFISMVSPDTLDASYHRKYDFTGVDAVYVMSVADARSVSWTALVSGSRGAPLIGWVPSDTAADEVIDIADSSLIGRRVIAIADDGLVADLEADAMGGACRHGLDLEGTVQADLLSTRVARALTGISLAEPAVAVAEKGLSTSPMTALSATTTGGVAVSIINPDSMYPGGWCGAVPTPHP